MRYHLRTLMLLLTVLPPLLAVAWWSWSELQARYALQQWLEAAELGKPATQPIQGQSIVIEIETGVKMEVIEGTKP